MATSVALRQINQARILATLRRGSWSRVALADELGLNRSTATVIVNDLLRQDLVREFEVSSGKRSSGRPRVGVGLNPRGAYFAGLVLGDTELTAVIADLTGTEISRASAGTDLQAEASVAEEQLGDMLAALLADAPGISLAGMGLTVPSVVTRSGQLEWSAVLPWRDVSIGTILRSRFGGPVRVENDANAAALAEDQVRPADEGDNLVFVYLDTGVGIGLILDGELYRGRNGRVGESGHIPLFSGANSRDRHDRDHTVEGVLGRTALLDDFERSFGRSVTWANALARLDGDDPEALPIRDEWQDTLGWFTSALAWTLDPDVVVFGGPGSALLRGDTTSLERSLRHNGPDSGPVRWRCPTNEDPDPAQSAAALAMRDFFEIPRLSHP